MRAVLILGAVTVAVFAGCTRGGASRSAAGSLGDFQTHANSIREATIAHGQAIAAATSLGEIQSLEVSHFNAMEGQFASMSGDMDDMMGDCGSGPMGDLDDEFSRMQDECNEHMATMGSAGTMGDAGDEENAHQAAMAAMLDSMGAMEQSMMPMMGDCSGGMMGGMN